MVSGGLGRRRDLRDKIRVGVAGRAGPGKGSRGGGGRPHTLGLGCSPAFYQV